MPNASRSLRVYFFMCWEHVLQLMLIRVHLKEKSLHRNDLRIADTPIIPALLEIKVISYQNWFLTHTPYLGINRSHPRPPLQFGLKLLYNFKVQYIYFKKKFLFRLRHHLK